MTPLSPSEAAVYLHLSFKTIKLWARPSSLPIPKFVTVAWIAIAYAGQRIWSVSVADATVDNSQRKRQNALKIRTSKLFSYFCKKGFSIQVQSLNGILNVRVYKLFK